MADDEQLARYVLSSSWLYKDNRAGCPLRPTAFLPHPRIELSVYRINGWSEGQIVRKGQHVAEQREQTHREKQIAEGKDYPAGRRSFRYFGRGEVQTRSVRSTGLDVVPKEPPERHADIIGWPPLKGDRKADEAAQMAYALQLQSKARFVAA